MRTMRGAFGRQLCHAIGIRQGERSRKIGLRRPYEKSVRSSNLFFAFVSMTLLACATGSKADDTTGTGAAGGQAAPSLPMPGKSSYTDPPKEQQPSTTPPAPTTTGTSTSGSTPPPPPPPPPPASDPGPVASGACGLCDRNWHCGDRTDFWATKGSTCVNTGGVDTVLHCNGTFDQDGIRNYGDWDGDYHGFTMWFGFEPVDCRPAK